MVSPTTTRHPLTTEVERDLRRAWLSLLLFPVSFLAAVGIGEGLVSLMGYPSGGPESAPWFVAVLAATPALVVFAVPGLLALAYGRRAARAGARSALVPAVLGTVVALGFVALNVLAAIVGAL
jgi:hypothetical protein